MSGPNTATRPPLDPTSIASFHAALKASKRIIAILGAGLSAPSGLSTFRSPSSLWKNQDVLSVASPAGFRHDPGQVWQFYSYRRREALRADPNPAHHALAQLAHRVPGFLALSQNVDHLSQRAGHPAGQLKLLHGDLFDLKCADEVGCGYVERGNFADPLTPALDTRRQTEQETMGRINPDAVPKASPLLLAGIARKNAQIMGEGYQDTSPTSRDLAALRKPSSSSSSSAAATAEDDMARSDQITADSSPPPPPPAVSDIRLSSGLKREHLPPCPKCKTDILRPAVVWFGESLPEDIINEADAFLHDEEPVDLCLTIGTSSTVWPAAGYAEMARKKGARIAVINIDAGDAKNIRQDQDWVFVGDAAVVLPELLRPVIGEEVDWKQQAD